MISTRFFRVKVTDEMIPKAIIRPESNSSSHHGFIQRFEDKIAFPGWVAVLELILMGKVLLL